MTTYDVEDFLSGSGARSAKFPTIGTTVKGIIESAVVEQQRDIETGLPKTWDDGNPMMQLVVTLDTDERESGEDDGKRRLFVKGQMRAAVVDALKAAGVKAIEVGGTLAVKYSGNGTAKKAAWTAPKQYVAQYKAPIAASVTVDELL
jgi:hypothetical protein